MDLLDYLEAFHREAAKLFDILESAGEAGQVEWANGLVAGRRLYLLWFQAAGVLAWSVEDGEEGHLQARTRAEAVAAAQRLAASLRSSRP